VTQAERFCFYKHTLKEHDTYGRFFIRGETGDKSVLGLQLLPSAYSNTRRRSRIERKPAFAARKQEIPPAAFFSVMTDYGMAST
jgi:hypothetical protein